MPTATRSTKRVACQTAGTLPATDPGWTTQPLLRFVSASEGAGQILGDAVVEQDFGQLVQVNTVPVFADVEMLTGLEGKLLRLLVEDDAGTVDIDGVDYLPFWVGVIVARDRVTDGGAGDAVAGRARWTAAGLASVLDQITISGGAERTATNPARHIDPGYCPAFNRLPKGDRSTATITINGAAVFVHDRVTTGSGVRWSAADIVRLLLAFHARPAPQGTPTGWTWSLSDPTGALSYEPDNLDLNGATILAAINTLISPARGLTWRLSVSGSTATIVVASTARSAITVGPFTLPASTTTAALNLVGDVFRTGRIVVEDQQSTYDVIEVIGQKPWAALTLFFSLGVSSQLAKGWSTAAETAWDADPQAVEADGVWRRFEVKTEWPGVTFLVNDKGLRDGLTRETSAAYGTNGHNGDRTFTTPAADDAIPAFALQAERLLPCGPDFSTDRLAPRLAPLVFLSIDAGATWEDITQTHQVQVEANPPAIRIDDGEHGQSLAELFEGAGGADVRLAVTMAFREARPLRVSFNRDPAQWPRTLPRVKSIAVAAEQWLVIASTARGLTGAAALDPSAEIVIRDDVPAMRQLLALSRVWWIEPARTAIWTDRAILDVGSTFRPGTLVTDVTDGHGTTAVNAVISRRRWSVAVRDGVPMHDTSYETARIVPDVGAVL